MPAVLTAASFSPKLSIVENDEEKPGEEGENWNYFALDDDRQVGIHTAGLEDKVYGMKRKKRKEG